ncbi:MAG TPA: sulfatase [Lacunisphaera sp.]|nr:sulfatase [Lacunisphaera sp.]
MKPPRLLLAFALLGTFIASPPLRAAPPAKKNVLFIVSDDLNNSLGCYGNPVVKSPNIDRLATKGMRFDRAYCNYPVCNPSRVSFLSGIRPDETKIIDLTTPTRTYLKDWVFLPEYFRRQGYRTFKAGKIYHTGRGMEDPRSWDEDFIEPHYAKETETDPAHIVRRQGPDGIVIRANDEDTWEGFVARKTVSLIEEAVRQGKPFFAAAGFRRPHRPYVAPEKYFALYNPDELLPRLGPPEHLAAIPDEALTYKIGINPRFPTERPGDTIAAYYASISFMDAQVGVLLDALDRLDLWKNTVVVFISDHGYHLGEHGGLWHKLSLFDEGTRMPLIVATPDHAPGVSERLVELVDLYPTLTDLCGLATPAGLEGTSFKPVLEVPDRPWKRAIFTVVSRPHPGESGDFGDLTTMGRTVFDGRWRYTEWPQGGVELYDHHSDPLEYQNLAADPAHQDRQAAMKQLLHDGWKAGLPTSTGSVP